VQSTEQHACILFADICDSMPIYEESGDESALAVIAQCLDELADLATRHGGKVIRSKGDDVLCIFELPASALDAAEAMVDAYGSGIPTIHVGIHAGPVIRARQDIYGDAVNVAARMLALAKPGEIVASQDVIDALPEDERDRLAPLGNQMVKGKQERIEVYSLVHDEGAATQMIRGSGEQDSDAPPETVMQSVAVELEYNGQIVTVHDGDRCLIGRAQRCDLVVLDLSVSREHARIDVHSGRATLTDQSSTGSWILDDEGGHTTLRRETGTLGKRGIIRLGRHPKIPQPAPEINFSLRRHFKA
jgi:adenylate cyclase